MEQVVRVVAEQRLGSRVHERDVPVLVHLEHAVGEQAQQPVRLRALPAADARARERRREEVREDGHGDEGEHGDDHGAAPRVSDGRADGVLVAHDGEADPRRALPQGHRDAAVLDAAEGERARPRRDADVSAQDRDAFAAVQLGRPSHAHEHVPLQANGSDDTADLPPLSTTSNPGTGSTNRVRSSGRRSCTPG